MDFLQTLETFRAGDASVQKLFGGEGTGVRTGGRRGPQYMASLAEAAGFVADVMDGRRPAYQLREALTTSDFPLLFGDIIDRQLLANYREWPATYRNYCAVKTVADFRTVKRFAINGSEATLAVVPQETEYPQSKLSDASYSYAVSKYGRAIPFAWETIINDDLDALRDVPARFGRAARRTEEKFATQLFADANGPHASLYTSGNKNQIIAANGAASANPVLGVAGLQDGFKVLGAMQDSDGEPIAVDAVELVVPPALEIVALNILNATELWLNEAGGSANQQVHVMNWMRNRTRLSVNPYLPIVSPTNGNTSWYLFASVASGGRPALEMGFLRGHTEPEVFMKSPNAVRVGGGMANPQDGDFDTDSIQYKLRHVLGGVREDPKMTVASNGSGA